MTRLYSSIFFLAVAAIHGYGQVTVGAPEWQGSFTYSGTTYNYKMIGSHPGLSGTRTTKVPTQIMPLTLTFSDGTTFDAEATLPGSTINPAIGVLASPVFSSLPISAGSVNLGVTQLGDAFQRAEFWNNIDSQHDFHVLLNPPTIHPFHLTVPAQSGHVTVSGSTKTGHVDWAFLNPFLRSKTSAYPNAYSVWLIVSTKIYNFNNTGGGDISGYHNGITTNQGRAFYSVSLYSTTTDVRTVAHETLEWLNDPENNVVPNWTSPSDASVCKGLLEVADPVEKSPPFVTWTISNLGFTFHLPDAVFIPWFARNPTSHAVNHWYTLRNELFSPANNCSAFASNDSLP